MKNNLLSILLTVSVSSAYSQVEWKDISLDNVITNVQPMTGIVYWNNSENNNTDAITLEFSYMLYNEVVRDSGVYNWEVVESKLNDIASRKHQAIFRFRYVYPGYKTSVPRYILKREDYQETIGNSEGKRTSFPDWTNAELKRFTLEFYTKFAERYDNDPRLAFIQVGFGLWAEYHIYSGPFILGKTFPSKEFQEEFFRHLEANFINIPWSISIDAASNTYSPFKAKPELKNIKFGLFDDSFMHGDHADYNTTCWNFFDRERYKISPAGGEFSYYSDYDQAHVLDYPSGPYGKPFETFAKDFHISYIMGNDQPRYQTYERIKAASMASGYKFKIVRLQTASETSVFEILNYGVAPIYYDAYIAVNHIRATESLKLLAPGETKSFSVSAGAENAEITIECDKLVPGQEIQFYGTQQLTVNATEIFNFPSDEILYPNPVKKGSCVNLTGNMEGEFLKYSIYNILGQLEISDCTDSDVVTIQTGNLNDGMHLLKTEHNNKVKTQRLVIL